VSTSGSVAVERFTLQFVVTPPATIVQRVITQISVRRCVDHSNCTALRRAAKAPMKQSCEYEIVSGATCS